MIMQKNRQRDIIHRWEGNPIITLDDLSFRCADICNAAAVKFDDIYLLLITIEDLRGIKSLYIARSHDGYRFSVDDKPFITPATTAPFEEYERRGVFDSKITKIGDSFYITYIAGSKHGSRLALAETKDFKKVKKRGFISEPDTKGGVLFPEKINGKFAKLEMPADGGRLWISYSDDLVYWGGYEEVMSPRGGFWDFHKVGPAVPPVRIADGRWLLIYYGVKNTSAGSLSRIGAAFLDSEDPSIVVSRTNVPIISPREIYERVGDVPNTVCVCGAICEDDKIMLYYGVARSCICLGMTTLDELVEHCIESEKEF